MLKKVRNIGLGIIVIVIGGVAVLWSLLSKEHSEGINLPIGIVNFNKFHDGTFDGKYEGGQFKWRANKVQVTVSSGKVSDIKLLEDTEERPTEFTNALFNRVIKSQTLQVDTISGATISSKAYLKAVEDALSKSLHQ